MEQGKTICDSKAKPTWKLLEKREVFAIEIEQTIQCHKKNGYKRTDLDILKVNSIATE